MNDYYVYGYSDPTSTNEYFYIGKGRKNRVYEHLNESKRNRKSHFYDKLRKMKKLGIQPRISFFAHGLINQQAIDLEIKLIAKYGRLDSGTGCLCNHTGGGEGTSGHSRLGYETSLDTRIKQSLAASNRSKEESELRQRSAIESRGRSICAVDQITGQIVMQFDSIRSTKERGFHPQAVSNVLSGRMKSHGGYFWRDL